MSTAEAVNSLVKALTKFFLRDLVYILGGGSIILSLLYVYGKLPAGNLGIITYFIGIGLSYAIGYAVQDVLTLLRLVRTKAGVSPNKFAAYLYRFFERRPLDFQTVINQQYEDAKRWLYKEAPERFRIDHERTESLKQIGTVLGPCFALAGIVVLFGGSIKTNVPFNVALGVGAILLGIALWCLGWVKVTQQAQYLLKKAELANKSQTEKNSGGESKAQQSTPDDAGKATAPELQR